MKHQSKIRMALAVLLVVSLAGSLPVPYPASPYAHAAQETSAKGEFTLGSSVKDSYDQYAAQHKESLRPSAPVVIRGESYSGAEGMSVTVLDRFEGSEGKAVRTEESGTIHWEVDVKEPGLYNLGVRYFPVQGKGGDIDRELLIDGKNPFSEAKHLVFRRNWKDKHEIKRDENGNDMYTPQIESPVWQDVPLENAEGRYDEPYSFYFSSGKHVISLVSVREPMVIEHIKLYQTESIPSYKDVALQYEKNGYKPAKDALVKVQGEAAAFKSSAELYPRSDRSSPATEPYHVSKIRYNTIGGNSWSEPGKSITWELEVPEDGLYKLGIKYNQSFQRGVTSYRKLWIDGKVPFQEMKSIPFDFGTDWSMKTLGDGDKPYLFYLTKGKHELKLEVSLGDMAVLMRTVESSILDLNGIYRRIVMVTGSTPDEYRDYQLELKIPEMLDSFRKQSDALGRVASEIERLTGGKSDRTATLNRLVYQLNDMTDRPETIPKRMESFKTNISSLGDWIFSGIFSPLQIDYLTASSPETKLQRPDATWFQSIKHQVAAFFISFFTDYNALGSSSKSNRVIQVWVTNGLRQAQVVKSMIEETFMPNSGIAVDLRVVSADVLQRAVLAGKGPDIAFTVGEDTPVNYALRNASEELSKFKGFADVKKRFLASSFVPYEFNGGVYGIPTEQYFPVLFYRKDILDELKLSVPKTWDDVYAMIPELQKQNLEFGFPIQVLVKLGTNVQAASQLPVNTTFATMLLQDNGELYKDGGKASALDSETSVKAFQEWTDLYSNYKLSLTTDFINRFRIGEMPIGIADYTNYNIISAIAPELKGLWSFSFVPGTAKPDGSIRREVPGAGSATIMLKSSKDKEAAWEFLQWWSGDDIQARFGREMESIFGPAGRYAAANVGALSQIPWPVQDYKVLREQLDWVRGIPQVAGGYFTGRHLDNAFRSVVISGDDPRESIDKYVRFIDDEIVTKRKEFGLPN
ncbi:extracellular solute-binding protein [Paenibacillus sp. MBLB4367]|uniref:extracellular solute-binding protein n=1 Tax=Paenibacillus sp. MBLB4367 TaxID=3384767 RepID=UPI003907FD01